MAKTSASVPVKAIIFCGGVGTRIWPMSRKKHPKQFQQLVGNKSMFQTTISRVLKGFKPEDIYVSTGEEYIGFIKKQAPMILKKNIIAEPVRRDTLGAVGLANLFVYNKFPNATVAAIWGADHIVKDIKGFNQAVKKAAEYSNQTKKLVKIDVRPTFPSEHNGWVKIGDRISRLNGFNVHEFVKFIEKPNEEKAKKLFRSHQYLINTGYLVWPAKLMHNLFKLHQPKAYRLLEEIRPSLGKIRQNKVIKQIYPKFKKTSIDYGIFENLSKKDTVVIPVDIGWSDVGTWELLFESLADNKKKDNLTKGQVYVNNVKRSIVYSTVKNKIVSVIGLNDVVIVDTADGLVVCNMHDSDQIKQLVALLKEKKLTQYV